MTLLTLPCLNAKSQLLDVLFSQISDAPAVLEAPRSVAPSGRDNMKSSSEGLAPLPPVEQLWTWYCQLRSVHRIQAEYSVSHSRVHRALLAAGYRLNGSKFTPEDDALITRYYHETPPAEFSLEDLTAQLRRPHHTNVCRRARALGLTDQKRPSSRVSTEASRLGLKAHHAVTPHPRGMRGKKHAPDTLVRLSEISRTRWDAMSAEDREAKTTKMLKTKAVRGNLANPRPHASWKSGWHEIGGKRHYLRSQWEVNYAHYLEWLKQRGEIKDWEYEPETFWFETIRRGTRSYLPDFRVTENSGAQTYHEVKGWMDDRSQTKLRRMTKYHPTVVIVLIDTKAYRELSRKVAGLVPGWL